MKRSLYIFDSSAVIKGNCVGGLNIISVIRGFQWLIPLILVLFRVCSACGVCGRPVLLGFGGFGGVSGRCSALDGRTVWCLAQGFTRHLALANQPHVARARHVEEAGRLVHPSSVFLTARQEDYVKKYDILFNQLTKLKKKKKT